MTGRPLVGVPWQLWRPADLTSGRIEDELRGLICGR
jgi:hypothetical protein